MLKARQITKGMLQSNYFHIINSFHLLFFFTIDGELQIYSPKNAWLMQSQPSSCCCCCCCCNKISCKQRVGCCRCCNWLQSTVIILSRKIGSWQHHHQHETQPRTLRRYKLMSVDKSVFVPACTLSWWILHMSLLLPWLPGSFSLILVMRPFLGGAPMLSVWSMEVSSLAPWWPGNFSFNLVMRPSFLVPEPAQRESIATMCVNKQ